MKILVINGDCIQTNSSANLCHLAYINGLIEAGHEVELLSADGRDYDLDPSMIIPPAVKQHTYYGVSLYEKMSLKKHNARTISAPTASVNATSVPSSRRVVQLLKSTVLSMYGIHGIYTTFVRKAAGFRSDTHFDYVLSISTPVTSHLLAHNLLKKKHIHAKHWIQIWEDPWYSDAYGFNDKDKIRREEQRLLSFADRVCYVSPLTLKNQQRIYPESAFKMFWQPLPYYYKNEESTGISTNHHHYGYFGAYYPEARNLEPFYTAAKEAGVEVDICGDPSSLFAATEQIHIHSRLPLQELKPIEAATDVLIFLCNRKGGQIPGKIYQYSATRKTILFILDGTEEEQVVLKDYFGKFNRYVFCKNTREDILKAILCIEAGNMGDVRNEPLECFNPVTTINNILSSGR